MSTFNWIIALFVAFFGGYFLAEWTVRNQMDDDRIFYSYKLNMCIKQLAGIRE
jgi:uncharacterized protein YneF (UPF0154 family)